MASASWVGACYKAGALNLTVLGATVVAAIATLAFPEAAAAAAE